MREKIHVPVHETGDGLGYALVGGAGLNEEVELGVLGQLGRHEVVREAPRRDHGRVEVLDRPRTDSWK